MPPLQKTAKFESQCENLKTILKNKIFIKLHIIVVLLQGLHHHDQLLRDRADQGRQGEAVPHLWSSVS